MKKLLYAVILAFAALIYAVIKGKMSSKQAIGLFSAENLPMIGLCIGALIFAYMAYKVQKMMATIVMIVVGIIFLLFNTPLGKLVF